MEVLVFGGTAEGRLLVEWLAARGTCSVVACTATEYGASLVEGAPGVAVVRGPLSDEEKHALMSDHDFCCVVDATHPYAQHISASVDALGRAWGLEVVRIARDDTAAGSWTSAATAQEAAQEVERLLARVPGNVLLTTGTKDLAAFTEALADVRERLYVRILPVADSLARARDLGVAPSRIVAMQGPFSASFNAALMRELNVACVVTKRSGRAGGFEEKVRAARECGAELVVIERPPGMDGVSLADAMALLEERYGL